ncbi:unnamed protein product, partial [Rotaria sordida]
LEAAAAVTVVVMTCGCALNFSESSPIQFKADRPFLFFIREIQQSIVLLSDKFVSPAAAP